MIVWSTEKHAIGFPYGVTKSFRRWQRRPLGAEPREFIVA
jgi:hypothetical protein